VRRFDPRLPWALLLVLVLAGLFWGLSRGPALHEKATMAGEVALDALGFDTWIEVREDDSFARKLYGTTVNWIATNRIGMTFGVLFGGALMTVFSIVRRRRTPSLGYVDGVKASALGVVSGAPLGVCVNCAAPIAHGLVAGGSRFETALSAMMASPTMNGVALFLLFTLFPLHVALVKIGLTLLLLLAIVPLLARTWLRADRDRTLRGEARVMRTVPEPPSYADGDRALPWVLRTFGRNAFFVARTTVPLMLVAGAFGALVVLVLPLDRLPELLAGETLAAALLVSVGLAFFGAALPVPITFDVILCAVLYAAGLPLRYVAVLLFTLGVYSVYSGLVVSRALSVKSALVLYLAVALLGVVAGDVTQALANAERRAVLEQLATLPEEEPAWLVGSSTGTSTEPEEGDAEGWGVELGEEVGRGVRWRPPRVTARASDTTRFVTLDAESLGFSVPSALRYWSFEYPFVQGRGRALTVGDVDADGLDDLVIVSEAGVVLYRNASEGERIRFEARTFPMDGVPLFAALVDLDADGALDLVVAELDGLRCAKAPLTDEDVALTRCLSLDAMPSAFGFDTSASGELVGVVSTWAPSWRSPWKTNARSADHAIRRDGDGFVATRLSEVPGAATSVLFHDLDDDGDHDVIVGHDFAPPDAVYRGEDGFERDESLVPATTRDTMGIAAGDLDGDGHDELFFTDIAEIHGGPRLSVEEACATIDEPTCERDAELTRAYLALRRRDDPSACDALPDPAACRAAYFLGRAHLLGASDEGCAFPSGWSLHRALCAQNVESGFVPDAATRALGPLQRRGTNVMLRWRGGRYVEDTPASVAHTGWTWHPRFVDANGDGDLDLFLATGTPTAVARRESNELFLGDGRGGLVRATEELGLVDHRPTASAVWIDLEGDGDLDLVSLPIHGPLQVRRNEGSPAGITVALDGPGLGARVTLTTAAGTQRRRLRASGGYLAFDEGSAHFGLGGETSGEVHVTWPDGAEQRATVRSGRATFRHPAMRDDDAPSTHEVAPAGIDEHASDVLDTTTTPASGSLHE
jgi:uncharacterized membrane protein YraQ (UPF0718 family)